MLTGSCALCCAELMLCRAVTCFRTGLSYAPPTGTPSNGSSNGNGAAPATLTLPAVKATVTVPASMPSSSSSSSRDVATAAAAAAAAPVAARTLLSMEEEEMTSDQIQCRWGWQGFISVRLWQYKPFRFCGLACLRAHYSK